MVEIAGCQVTILDQQEPQVRYVEKGQVRTIELESNSFPTRGKESVIADPRLREVLAKVGPTPEEVLWMVTCRTYDPVSTKVSPPKK